MDDDQLADLKQFILATVSQATADLPRRDEIESRFSALETKMEQGFADIQEAIGETIVVNNDAADEQLQGLKQRVTKLEQQPA